MHHGSEKLSVPIHRFDSKTSPFTAVSIWNDCWEFFGGMKAYLSSSPAHFLTQLDLEGIYHQELRRQSSKGRLLSLVYAILEIIAYNESTKHPLKNKFIEQMTALPTHRRTQS